MLAVAGTSAWLYAGTTDARDESRTQALVHALEQRRLFARTQDVEWLRVPPGLRGATRPLARALVRAHLADEPCDLFIVEARTSPEGRLLDMGAVHNLTHSSGVDEGPPERFGAWMATITTVDGIATGVHVFDLDGRSADEYADFSRVQRFQVGVTNFQQTGQTRGVVHDVYSLDPAARSVQLQWESESRLVVVADTRRIVIDPERRTAVVGGGWVRIVPEARARPGHVVTWAVDRARALPFIGEEGMQWIKALAFTAKDWLQRAQSQVKDDRSAEEVEADLGGVNSGVTVSTFSNPETGWPPAPMEPILRPALPHEGEWIALDRDPFITPAPNTPPAFVTSFLRADRERKETRVYVTLWDPRLIALHMEAGRVEPVSASGEAGTGVVPRAPEVMRRLVAGFNGGFQAKHGEFGMQANGLLYLPPKPYAATVFELGDGSTAFGTWPNSENVPDEVLSYRQNMTALVELGKFNPWRRTWWGGTPEGWADTIHTTRSALCLTKEKFVGYFWGNDISPSVLADALLAARCSYGVHLDMNPGLAGFEFYNVQAARTFKPLGRPLVKDWEDEGTVKEMPEFRYRVRRMVRGMQHQNFPQYIHRHERDFFYLTRRPALPGEDLPSPGAAAARAHGPSRPSSPAAAPSGSARGPAAAPAPSASSPSAHRADAGVPPTITVADEGKFWVKGLPQHGYPYAIAVTTVHPDAQRPELRLRVMRIDPRCVQPAGAEGTTDDTPTIVTFSGGTLPRKNEVGVFLQRDTFALAAAPPDASAVPLLTGIVPSNAEPSGKNAELKGVRTAVGIHDEEGMLQWVEFAPESPTPPDSVGILLGVLAESGCSRRMVLRAPGTARVGGTLDLDGASADPVIGPTARLVRAEPPSARLYFDSTAIVPPTVWQPLQAKRVRYFRKPAKP